MEAAPGVSLVQKGAVMARITVLATFLILFTASAQAAVTGERVTLPAKERQVNVTLFRAPGDKPRGSVLMLHGAGGFDRQIDKYNQYASALAESGFDAYLIYYRSDSDMKRLQTGENVFEARLSDWVVLVDNLADDLVKQKSSNGKVGLIGFSDGGTLSTGAAAQDKNVAAAVIYYGIDSENFGIEEKRFPPMLLLHGDADTTITWMNSELLAQHVKSLNAPVEFVLYPGEKHGFGADTATKHGADALKRTLTFLHQKMDK
jgi:carboxymethylenebutenolidase